MPNSKYFSSMTTETKLGATIICTVIEKYGKNRWLNAQSKTSSDGPSPKQGCTLKYRTVLDRSLSYSTFCTREQKGNQLWKRQNATQSCHLQCSAPNVRPTLQCQYFTARYEDQGQPTHDHLHTCLWNAIHSGQAQIPARIATREVVLYRQSRARDEAGGGTGRVREDRRWYKRFHGLNRWTRREKKGEETEPHKRPVFRSLKVHRQKCRKTSSASTEIVVKVIQTNEIVVNQSQTRSTTSVGKLTTARHSVPVEISLMATSGIC